MAENDDRRVVGVPLSVAGGMTATAEGIAELERRRIAAQRAEQPEPTRAFSEFIKARKDDEEAELSEKEKRFAALPKKGPRPSLVHPGQRDAYGRNDETDDPVIIKG